jgi:hypothetical protein
LKVESGWEKLLSAREELVNDRKREDGIRELVPELVRICVELGDWDALKLVVTAGRDIVNPKLSDQVRISDLTLPKRLHELTWSSSFGFISTAPSSPPRLPVLPLNFFPPAQLRQPNRLPHHCRHFQTPIFIPSDLLWRSSSRLARARQSSDARFGPTAWTPFRDRYREEGRGNGSVDLGEGLGGQ